MVAVHGEDGPGGKGTCTSKVRSKEYRCRQYGRHNEYNGLTCKMGGLPSVDDFGEKATSHVKLLPFWTSRKNSDIYNDIYNQ